MNFANLTCNLGSWCQSVGKAIHATIHRVTNLLVILDASKFHGLDGITLLVPLSNMCSRVLMYQSSDMAADRFINESFGELDSDRR
jgi:hypothetical protein